MTTVYVEPGDQIIVKLPNESMGLTCDFKIAVAQRNGCQSTLYVLAYHKDDTGREGTIWEKEISR
jgi:hypothetical protein